ncbi:MAG: hypothetical protein MJD61_13980 [Proteobacteria bacterium]|nr:hypothetical protein [Pseudomonadota bacterium]
MRRLRSRNPASPRAVLALLCCMLTSACSQAGPHIVRVQTNLVDKAVFDGTWWYATTVVDTDYDEAAIFGSAGVFAPFSGSMSTDFGIEDSWTMARIRWVIDQNTLFAHRAHELVQGGNPDAGAPRFKGQPLAAFTIEAHVDVRQDYNPLTGEGFNVLSENTSDRRWFERQFMRVDWSRNLVTPFAPNAAEGALFLQFTRESVPFFFQENAHQDFPKSYEPQFVRIGDDPDYRFHDEWPSNEAETVHYMSFVTQEIWSPGSACLQASAQTQADLGRFCSAAAVTVRNSFLRVPPEHEYGAETANNSEFDHFGYFRSLQPTYAQGGQNRAVQRAHCESDADCGGAHCDLAQHICVGGLTNTYGETDFLAFYRPRHNFYSDSLEDTECASDWECNARFDLSCSGEECTYLRASRHGSVCDRAARRCSVPLRSRPTRRVAYHLNSGYPPHLVRSAFEVIGGWNGALMKGQRAVSGKPPMDGSEVETACQREAPTAYCFCGSAEDAGGSCPYRYDPFQTPAEAEAIGVENPYDCYVQGPPDVAHPKAYDDYKTPEVYGYEFEGSECLLVLKSNSCDRDPALPCEELGDLRYQFFNYIEHGGTGFGGVSLPLIDPTNGELITSNANIAAVSVERVGTLATQLFPLLRGEIGEEEYFAGENLRGYFSRLGRVHYPVALAPGGDQGYGVRDPARPTEANPDHEPDVAQALRERLTKLAPKLRRLQGSEGRALGFGHRLRSLEGTAIEQRLLRAMGADGREAVAALASQPWQSYRIGNPDLIERLSPARKGFVQSLIQERQRLTYMGKRGIDPPMSELYNARYWQYWADAFKGYPPAEASIRMQQAWLTALQYHEMGHSMGLTHNFAASLDRNQYHDGYFRVARSLPLPRYESYDQREQGGDENGRVTGQEAQRWAADLRQVRNERAMLGGGNVMTSSVMDYAGDLSGFSGLGRYDHAAVLFNYFNLVEAYTGYPVEDDPSSTLDGLLRSDQVGRTLWTYYRGGEACEENLHCPHSVKRSNLADDQAVYQRCVANPRLRNPLFAEQRRACNPGRGDRDCLCSNFYDDFEDYVDGLAYRDVRTDPVPSFYPVRYLFCADDRTNDLSWCSRHDAGESFREVIDHYRRLWEENYPRTYFRNYRRGGPVSGQATSWIVDATKIYQHLFFRLFYEEGFQSDTGPLGLNDQLFASVDALNWLAQLASMPDVGSYRLDPTANLYRKISSKPGLAGADLSLEPGQGFHLWSTYQDGLNGFFRTERAGTFFDKMVAIFAIANRDWGLNFRYDERFFISFHDLFPQETSELLGGFVLRDPRQYAPRAVLTPEGAQLTYLDTYRGQVFGACFDAGEPVACRASQDQVYPEPAIDGTDAEVLRDWATITALAFFPVYFDTTFEQQLSVFKLGSGDGHKLPAERRDGTPTCFYGQAGCSEPDYIIYGSDRLHTSYVAVSVKSELEAKTPEEQVGFELLRRLYDRQERLQALSAQPQPSPEERAHLDELQRDIERDESFLDYLIEVQRAYGISSYF